MTIRRSTSRASSKYDPLSQEQLQHLLVLSTEDPTLCDLHDVVVIMSNTGIRPGELRELLWTDVDVKGHRLVVAFMTSASNRSVPFGPKTLQMLQSRHERHPDAEYVLGESPLELLRHVSRQLRTVCDGIGVHGVTLRVLRRTFFERMFSAGASAESCRTIGGYRFSFETVLHTFVSADRRFEMAARDQARIEEL
jgi:integrase